MYRGVSIAYRNPQRPEEGGGFLRAGVAMWVLGIQPRSSRIRVGTLNYCAISQAPCKYFWSTARWICRCGTSCMVRPLKYKFSTKQISPSFVCLMEEATKETHKSKHL